MYVYTVDEFDTAFAEYEASYYSYDSYDDYDYYDYYYYDYYYYDYYDYDYYDYYDYDYYYYDYYDYDYYDYYYYDYYYYDYYDYDYYDYYYYDYYDYYYYDYYDYYSYDSYGYYDYYYGAYYDSMYGDYYEGGDWDMGGDWDDMGNFTSEARGAVMDYFWYALDTNEDGGNSTNTCDTNMDCDGNGQTMCCVNIVSTSEDGMTTDQMFRCMNRGVAEMSWEQTLTTDSGDDMYVNLKCMADGAAFLKAGLASVFVLIASTY